MNSTHITQLPGNPNTAPNLNGGGDYSGEIHALDYGVHVHLLEEWNDGDVFNWGDAEYAVIDNVAIVRHPFTVGATQGVAHATYRADGEGDLITLVVRDDKGEHLLVDNSRAGR